MPRQFFTRAKILLLAISILFSMIASGCGLDAGDLGDLIAANQAISITLNEPSYDKDYDEGVLIEEPWVQLDQLADNVSLRYEVEKIFGVTRNPSTTSKKSGCMFIDQQGNENGNTTLFDACRNKAFVKLWKENTKGLASAANLVYNDVDGYSTESALASINGYYKLLTSTDDPDGFNQNSTLSREKFYALVYKAMNPVQELVIDDDFLAAVGEETAYTKYAQNTAQYGFLQVGNQSLDGKTIIGQMSRAEAAYIVANMLFADQLENMPADADTFVDCKNAGNLAFLLGFQTKEKGEITCLPRWQSYTLQYMVQHPDNGMQEELYKAVTLMKTLGIWVFPSNESRWDEPISKAEALNLLIKAFIEYSEANEYATEADEGVRTEIAVTPPVVEEVTPIKIDGINTVEAPDLTGLTIGSLEYGTAVATYYTQMNGRDITTYKDENMMAFADSIVPSLDNWSNINPLIPTELYLMPLNISSGNTNIALTDNVQYTKDLAGGLIQYAVDIAKAMGSVYYNFNYNEADAYKNNYMYFESINMSEKDVGILDYVTEVVKNHIACEGGFITDKSLVYRATDGSTRVRGISFIRYSEADQEWLGELKNNTWYVYFSEQAIAMQDEAGKYNREHSNMFNYQVISLSSKAEIDETTLAKLIEYTNSYTGIADLSVFKAN